MYRMMELWGWKAHDGIPNGLYTKMVKLVNITLYIFYGNLKITEHGLGLQFSWSSACLAWIKPISIPPKCI